jgi:protein-disulfide isomerase
MGDENGVNRLQTPVGERDHSQGPANAPVVLVEYGDFECPDCGRAFPMVKEIQKRLGIELRLVFRHFPNTRIHPHALRAAEAAEAAAAQGRFWEMHDYLFKHQSALEDKHLKHYARKIGLDTARFEHEMDAEHYAPRIKEDYYRSLYTEGITGTPTFYINGLRHNDSVNLERMMTAIKAGMGRRGEG